MSGYQLTPEAQSDLDDIAQFIMEGASVERAISVLTEIRDEFRKLTDMPGIGHFREDLLDKRFKFWPVFSFVIVYRSDVAPIQIIAVVHGARDLDAFFESRTPPT